MTTHPRLGLPRRAARAVAIAAALSASLAPGFVAAQAPAAPPAAPVPTTAAPVGPASQGISQSVAATVNDGIITTFDLAQRMRLLVATTGVQPTEQNIPQIQQEALISLIDERLELQELRRVEREQKISIIATEDEVSEEIARVAQSNNRTPEQFVDLLRSQGVDSSLREQIRAQVSWMRWIRGRYGTRLRVGEDQIRATEQQMAASASKPQYQISEVLIDAARVGGMQSAMDGASQLIAQMQQGAPFAAVARQFSASASAANGGDAGWLSGDDLPREVENAVAQMRPGQLSAPIPVREGVYIVYLRDKRSGAGGQVVHLKQAAAPLAASASPADVAAAQAKLAAVRPNITSCATVESAAARETGVIAGDLGEAEVKDLAPAFRAAAETLQPGQVSEPIRTGAGLHLIAVCGRRAAGMPNVSREDIEGRLINQQLSMISRRYLRDLRSAATIETR